MEQTEELFLVIVTLEKVKEKIEYCYESCLVMLML